jgi:hypothetical protein
MELAMVIGNICINFITFDLMFFMEISLELEQLKILFLVFVLCCIIAIDWESKLIKPFFTCSTLMDYWYKLILCPLWNFFSENILIWIYIISQLTWIILATLLRWYGFLTGFFFAHGVFRLILDFIDNFSVYSPTFLFDQLVTYLINKIYELITKDKSLNIPDRWDDKPKDNSGSNCDDKPKDNSGSNCDDKPKDNSGSNCDDKPKE